MEKTARAIIKKDNKYVFMKREKVINNELIKYYTIIGGHVENGENFEDTCVREVYEELGIKVKIDSLYYEFYNTDLDKYEKFYIVKYLSGNFGSGNGEEFTNIDINKYGKYEIVYIDEDMLEDYNILPIQIKEKLMNNK